MSSSLSDLAGHRCTSKQAGRSSAGPRNGDDAKRTCFRQSTRRASQRRSSSPSPPRCSKNSDWLFPTVSGGTPFFDKFCVLSLTYRSNGFITMLAPLRDYLRPRNLKSSPLLCTAKARYFTRMSVKSEPDDITYRKALWITSEDVNVEHLLDVFMTVDAGLKVVWDACDNCLRHLHWHKKRKTVLTPKIEGLPMTTPPSPDAYFNWRCCSNRSGTTKNEKRC